MNQDNHAEQQHSNPLQQSLPTAKGNTLNLPFIQNHSFDVFFLFFSFFVLIFLFFVFFYFCMPNFFSFLFDFTNENENIKRLKFHEWATHNLRYINNPKMRRKIIPST